MYCLQACPCITQPGNCTGWGSEGVKMALIAAHLNAGRSQSGSDIVQELCESRSGRPGLSVQTSLLVSVDVKQY